MATLLRIDSSARTSGSQSRELADHLEAKLIESMQVDQIVRHDLAVQTPSLLNSQAITGFFSEPDQIDGDLQAATAESDALIEQLQAADMLLLSVPIYNFGVPASLKAWIDQIVRINHTFAYDGSTFTGLAKPSRVYVVCAYGANGYLNGGPLSGADFVKPYLEFLFGFLGIADVLVVGVEGTSGDAASAQANMQLAREEIDQLIKL